MATTNYSLPTLESMALFDLVTDYNALANATDSALAGVAGLIPTETITEMEGQISALQTLTGSQGTQITTLQSQMTTANGNISTLQSGLVTANNNIGALQTGLQTANKNVQSANNEIKTLQTMMSPIIVLSDLNVSGGNCTVKGNVFAIHAAKILNFQHEREYLRYFYKQQSCNPSIFTGFALRLSTDARQAYFVGSAMSGGAACNLQLDIDAETGTITPKVDGINKVEAFKINGNAVLMYDTPVDVINS